MSKPLVLLVDNNRLVVDLIEGALKDEGFEFLKAYDGLEAIDAVEKRLPDIIVTDLIMPKIDGRKLCRYFRQNPRTANVPIIVLSGIASEDREGYREIDADAYLAKCAYDKLLPNVRSTIERLLGNRERERATSILGIEEIYPRELVKEFAIIKRHYDAILESMAEGVLEIDRERRVVLVNVSAEDVLGRSEEELIGMSICDIFDPSARDALEKELQAFEAGKLEHRTLVFESRGTALSARFSPIVREGAFHGLFVTLEDVTRQQELEASARNYTRRLEGEVKARTRELESRNAELERLNRLKDEFLGVLSHELRTPITPIKGYIELLRDPSSDRALFDKAVTVLKRQADHLERMLTDLLDLTAAQAGQLELSFEPCRVADVLTSALEEVGSQVAERRSRITLAPDVDLVVNADNDRLRQVMVNLIANAVKFSPEEADVEVRAKDDGEWGRIMVTDHGIGMSPDQQGLIFEGFRQVDGSLTRRYSGLGIGLTLAKLLVDAMQGRIEVESEEGKGSTFSVLLPKVDVG